MLPPVTYVAIYLSIWVSWGFGASIPNGPPTVTVSNGTYAGVSNPNYGTDFFLGMPYCQAPLGDLRFALPASLNTTFSGTQQATEYGPECVGYGVDQMGYPVSEDCLKLSVIRPTGTSPNASLPVLIWIHGGGNVMGGSADKRYNLTFIVQNSVTMGKPIVAVSMQYRLSAWGFLGGNDVQQAGVTNLGLKDQRLALHWIQENIQAFGGDPTKVTIWGESAGAVDVSLHAQAYGGRDDGLFRGIIAESIAGFASSNNTQQEITYANLTSRTGCGNATSSLQCLRELDYQVLNQAINTSLPSSYGPTIDGDFVPDLVSTSITNGRFVRVPFLLGSNTDEGTTFGPKGVNTDAEFAAFVASEGADTNVTDDIAILYPDDPAIGIPQTLLVRPNSTYGLQYKRSSAFTGDYIVLAPRRLHSQSWARFNVPSYVFRFNVLVSGASVYLGANHFQEFAFVVDNTQGLGYGGNPNPAYPDPFAGEPPTYTALASLMSRMWVSFAHDLDPNNHGVPNVATWPLYDTNSTNGYEENIVFDVNGVYSELDTIRTEAVQYLIDVSASAFHH